MGLAGYSAGMEAQAADQTPPNRPIDRETVTGALELLEDLSVWELAPQRRESVLGISVLGILDRIAEACQEGDLSRLRRAIAELELSGLVRALRIGTTTPTKAPQPVLDRCTTLLHELGAGQAQPDTSTQPPGADDAGKPAS